MQRLCENTTSDDEFIEKKGRNNGQKRTREKREEKAPRRQK